MKYSRIQFREAVVVKKSPYVSIKEAESLDVPTAEAARAYLIEDDGDNFIRITQAVGGISVRVPWSNVAGCVFAPVALLQIEEPPPPPEPEEQGLFGVILPRPEPKGLPELPRVNPTPRKRVPR